MIDLPNNFVISDQSDSLSIIKTILKEPSIKQAFEADHLEPVKPNVVQDRISKAKSKGWTHNMIQKHDQAGVIISDIYRQYQAELKRVNALDFDDLLIQGHRLFKRNPSTYANIQAVLVDEWQDTNTTQYEIAKELASKCRALTVVGDPDQSVRPRKRPALS
jgi:DNA helicase-2/ATP-dependent DNA helicase PcrA